MAVARFCTGAASKLGWVNGRPDMNDAGANLLCQKRVGRAAIMD